MTLTIDLIALLEGRAEEMNSCGLSGVKVQEAAQTLRQQQSELAMLRQQLEEMTAKAAEHRDGRLAALEQLADSQKDAARVEQPAPPAARELSDDEITDIWKPFYAKWAFEESLSDVVIKFARAVLAAKGGA